MISKKFNKITESLANIVFLICIIVLTFFISTSCNNDVPKIQTNLCSSNDDCPKGFHCDPEGYCVPNEDYDWKGLYADPEKVGFSCTTMGCSTTKEITVSNLTFENILLTEISLQEGNTSDFKLKHDLELPYIMEGGNSFIMTITYEPSDLEKDGGVIRIPYTLEKNLIESNLDIELKVRSIGSPIIEVTPNILTFSYAEAESQVVKPLTIENRGFGTALLAITELTISGLDSSYFSISESTILPIYVNPNEKKEVQISFSPDASKSYIALLIIKSSDPYTPEIYTIIQGTSHEEAYLTSSVSEINFGTQILYEQIIKTFTLTNEGGSTCSIEEINLSNGSSTDFNLSVLTENPDTLQPFESIDLEVMYMPEETGEDSGEIYIKSNSIINPEILIPLNGSGYDPQIIVSPETINFGKIMFRWSAEPVEVTIANNGSGNLTIDDIFMNVGSSDKFTIENNIDLPKELAEGEQILFNVLYSPLELASHTGTVVIKSNDRTNNELKLTLNGEGVTCDESCDLPNADPRCEGDEGCKVDSCDEGYYDIDLESENGCECQVETPEPSGFCSEGVYLGSVRDTNGDRITYQGKLVETSDIDWIKFFAEDSSSGDTFGDSYYVKINLTAPAELGVRMCIYYETRENHEDSCSLANETCPSNLHFELDGSYGSEDGRDFFIKVASTSQTNICGEYTLIVSNGD